MKKSSIHSTIIVSSRQLDAGGIESARLDSEIMLAYVLDVTRAWLVAHGDDTLADAKARKFEHLIARRLQREPVAYILRRKEFYGRDFIVTPDVLIPRPESEAIIDILKSLLAHSPPEQQLHNPKPTPALHRGSSSMQRVVDVGCGSGCLGITAKLELPELDVTLSDISKAALAVARRNAKKLAANVHFAQSDLLSVFLAKNRNQRTENYYDVIVANLPYVDRNWQTPPELRHEPEIALFADQQGLKCIKTLLNQAPSVLIPYGHLILEADPCQHDDIIRYAGSYGFAHTATRDYALLLTLNS